MQQARLDTHPSPQELQAFALGRLEGLAIESLESHLAMCDQCAVQLAAAPDDALVRIARQVGTQAVHGDGTLVTPSSLPAALVNHPRYRVRRLLGRGGMGEVYLAEHLLMQRPVALKIIRGEHAANLAAVERFEREAKAAARLKHPNIVAALDAERIGNQLMLAMEFVDGVALDEYVARSGPLTLHQTVDILRQTALGLAHAHHQGMIHRDIKPHNLMLTTTGEVKIVDFGLARWHAQSPEALASGAQTAGGMILGTPDFMAPEQIRDPRSADIRSDIYSLGCTAYFLLTGKPPFVAESIIERLSAHLHAEPTPITSQRPDVSPGLAAILRRMLAKQPADRFQAPQELIAALDMLPLSATPSPVRTSLHPRRAWATRRSVLVALLVALPLFAAVAWSQSWFSFLAPPDVRGKRVLFVVPPEQVWYADYGPTKARLEELGAMVVTASSRAGECSTLDDENWPQRPAVVADLILDRVRPEDYDAILFCGYQVTPFFGQAPDSPTIARLLGQFHSQQKTIGAICAGQAVLAQHHMLDGQRAAGGERLEASFPYHVPGGPEWTDQPVEVLDGGRIVTASHDRYARQFAEAIAAAVNR